MNALATPTAIKLVVFDWAGTIVDHGCFGPVAPFHDVYAANGVELSIEQVREPMGLDKRQHLEALAAMPGVGDQWRKVHGRELAPSDIDKMYQDFMPLQVKCIAQHCGLIPGLKDAVADLRRRGIKLAGTTGYFQEAAELCYATAREQGFATDANCCVTQVPRGRPAPWMLYRVMQDLAVYPPATVVKVGDTVPDIGEGLAAGAWSIGVSATGSDVGLTATQLAALPKAERTARIERAAAKLRDAGAHYVIESVAELPALVAQIEAQLGVGVRP